MKFATSYKDSLENLLYIFIIRKVDEYKISLEVAENYVNNLLIQLLPEYMTRVRFLSLSTSIRSTWKFCKIKIFRIMLNRREII